MSGNIEEGDPAADVKPEDIDEPYAENTPLTWIFGDHSKVRIIAAFLSEKDRDINVSDVARLAGIARSTVYEHLEDLVDHGIITPTRKISGSQLYQLNTDSDIVKMIAQIEADLLDNQYEE